MNKNQVINHLTYLGEHLSNSTVVKVENNDKVFAVEDIKETINDLKILIYEITRL